MELTHDRRGWRDRRPQAVGSRPRSRRPGTGTTGPTAPTSPPSARCSSRPTSSRSPRKPRSTTGSRCSASRVAPGSLPSYLVTISTIISAIVLPLMGAVADRTANKKRLLAIFAWLGALSGSLIFFATGEQLADRCGRLLPRQPLPRRVAGRERLDPAAHLRRGEPRPRLVARLGLGLPRRRAAARGEPRARHDRCRSAWTRARPPGISMLSACIWWAAFTLIPFLRLNDHEPIPLAESDGGSKGIIAESFGQLGKTLRELPQLPDGADLPARLPVLQRRHPDRDRVRVDLRLRGARLRRVGADRHDPAGAVRRLRRRAALRPARQALRLRSTRSSAGLVVWMVIVTAALFLPEDGRSRSCSSASRSASCSAAPRRWPGPTSRC